MNVGASGAWSEKSARIKAGGGEVACQPAGFQINRPSNLFLSHFEKRAFNIKSKSDFLKPYIGNGLLNIPNLNLFSFLCSYMGSQQWGLFLGGRKANAGKEGESKCDFLGFLTGKFPSEILSCPPGAGRAPRKKCRQRRNCPEIGSISRKKSEIATITHKSD